MACNILPINKRFRVKTNLKSPPGIMFVELFDDQYLPAMDEYLLICIVCR